MKPLKGFKGKWDQASQTILFEWDPKNFDTDCYVAIMEVVQGPNGFLLVERNSKLVDLKTEKFNDKVSLAMGTALPPGVSGHVFFGGSMTDNKEWNRDVMLGTLQQRGDAFLTRVMLGQAEISYSVKVFTKAEVSLVRFSVKTSANIDEFVLGYSYRLGNNEIINSFPPIQGGREIEFPAIAVPAGSDVIVKPYSEACCGNIALGTKKAGLFDFLKR